MFKSRSTALAVLLLLAILCISFVEATPQNKNNQQTPRDKVMKEPEGISADQGSGLTILDKTLTCNNLEIRMKISGPADQFTKASGVKGAAAEAGDKGKNGLMVLLHGDGGQSFTAYPNKGINEANQMGVVFLAPNDGLQWGGAPKGQQERPNGAADAQAVNDCIQKELPKLIAFDKANVQFMGVSGGSQMLSGFFMPKFMGKYPKTGALFSCGGMAPQVEFASDAMQAIKTTRIHFESTFNELESLQETIPQSIPAYEQAAASAGLSENEINQLQTVDNAPKGGHCAFDEKSFESGVQALTDKFVAVMSVNGNGEGFGKGVVGNENPKFGPEKRQ
ncbi:Cyclin-like F-box [Hirsutella rhossiliensis]|uniref:Cyclin-like F-box n=1 Tax=Hirsutella rhossiliensis TaxID=111463 RepID=A0A9P8MQG7_9HYPO|nr:Cyclin-like F-box [Hirsutella rhossiliensis]KAH0960403.1 Cyclin-like F-box [Hirsutella rhossiliensis]